MSSNKRRTRASFAGLAATAGFALLLAGCGTSTQAAGSGPSTSNAIVATYAGGHVTQSQLNTQIHLDELFSPTLKVTPTIKTEILKQYILSDRFLAPKAAQAGVKVTATQVQNAVLGIKQQYVQSTYSGSTSKFAQKMQTLGLTDADIAAAVKDQMMLQDYAPMLVKSVPLSQQQSYYKANLEKFTMVTERAILVKKQALATSLAQQLRTGGSWKTLAKKYSQDPGSSGNGGEYPPTSPSQWVPAFAQHAMTQPLNVVGDPFYASPYGYFVMEVLKRDVQPFAQVKTQIVQTLGQGQEQTAVNALITRVEKTANIKVLLK
ncbi:MAG: peptidylprolyl isomerase [Firmicutes bacterium]|nr:peptidylprolyl isomerase [Bacillota bacterium]